MNIVVLLACAFPLAGIVPISGPTDAQSVAIDILPGEDRNIVDPASPEPVKVALLGSPTLDAASILPTSVRLSGAAVIKDAEGRTHVLADVNGDGHLDLVVQFSARELLLAETDHRAVLEAGTVGGVRLRGEDAIQALAVALRSAEPVATDEEKLPPLLVGIEILPGAVAILAGPTFDPKDIPLASIRVNGQAIVKGPGGDLSSLEDVDGDGLSDLVVFASKAQLRGARVELDAVTVRGRIVRGEASGSGSPAEREPSAPAPDPLPKNGYPYVIIIPDASPATTYPAIIHVSGVSGVVSKLRVTLNEINHTCFNDLDVMLVAPNGQSLVLMSDVGGCNGIANNTVLTFDDFAAATLSPGATPGTPSTVRPINNGPGDPFPAPAPAPSGAGALSSFNGIDPNGDWKLFIVDDAFVDSGSIQQGWSLDIVTLTRVCNTTPISISDVGAGAPYPSSITLSGMTQPLGKVTVSLKGLTHTFPDDLDVMLVPPSNFPVMLMSDAGGNQPVSNLELTLDDDVAAALPNGTPIPGSSTVRPTDYEPGDVLPAPAPGGSVSTLLGSIRGFDPNGTWRLYVADDAVGDSGTIAGGWCLNVTTIAASEMCVPIALTIPAGAPASTAGPASLYPDTMSITGLTGLVNHARFRFPGLSHTFPDDLDILVQAPSGKSVMLMSDAGGSTDVTNLDLTIDTTSFTEAPDETPLGPGPYHPMDWSAGDSLPAPAFPAPYYSNFFGEAPNGTWKLYVADDAGGDWGTISGGWCMSLELAQPAYSLCVGGSAPLLIPGGGTSGIAFPYPWGFDVPLEGSVIRKIQVRLNGLSHTFPDDLDVLLLGPTGQAVALMSDAGGPGDTQNINLVFDDEAPAAISDEGQLLNGTYKPANWPGGDADAYPAPAPASYGTSLSVYNNTDPHGFWELLVQDDASGDIGVIGQWCIDVFPLYPAAEVGNLRWRADKTTLDWDAAANASGYSLLRGTPADLGNLLNGSVDSCMMGNMTQQSSTGVAALPPSGSFFWYLVVGTSGNLSGPAGSARLAGQNTPRSAEPQGICSPP